MELQEWLAARDGIAHRDDADAAGYGRSVRHREVASGRIRSIRRVWLATDDAPEDLVKAAEVGGRLTCVSLARHKKWWMPEGIDERRHLSLKPHGRSPGEDKKTLVHWGRPIAAGPALGLVDSPETALHHIAECLPRESAMVLWESAIRIERLSVDALRRVQWTSIAARECAASVNGLSDSGLETLLVVKLTPWGVRIRQQIVIAGHRVDVLVGERLVVQIDGFAHHSDAAQRGRDVAHDAELRLRGYTVLRFTYAQIVHDWLAVERTIARALAMGAHGGA